jgi:hypothetical protein
MCNGVKIPRLERAFRSVCGFYLGRSSALPQTQAQVNVVVTDPDDWMNVPASVDDEDFGPGPSA